MMQPRSSKSHGTDVGESRIVKDVAPFLKQLRAMLNEENPAIIRWTHNGRAFEIVDMEQMMTHVLPKYFKHRKYTSFQRQLNYFNFRKWTKSKATMCTFSNEFFMRDQPELAWRITRKKSVHTVALQPHKPLPHHASFSRALRQASDSGRSLSSASSTSASASEDEEDSMATFAAITAPQFAISVPTTSCEEDLYAQAPFPSPTDFDMMLKNHDYPMYTIEPTSLSAPPAEQLEPFEWIDALLPFVDRVEDDAYPASYMYANTASTINMSRQYDFIAL